MLTSMFCELQGCSPLFLKFLSLKHPFLCTHRTNFHSFTFQLKCHFGRKHLSDISKGRVPQILLFAPYVLSLCYLSKVMSNSCNPVDCSLPDSSVHGIFQVRILEWLPFPSPGDLPDPRTEPISALLVDCFPLSHQGSPLCLMYFL